MKAQDCPKFGPLQGVKVVNLTMAIAGPFACSLLADLGAEVIGVESPRGRDTSRPTNQALQGWGTQMERRNTRSLCMNVKDGAGRAWFFELLKQADILVDGFRGGQMAKWGMTDEALWEVNPKLTIAHISGFGQTGDPAYVSRASFDGIGQAYGCFMEMNGYPDRLPVLAFPQVSDYYAGFMASIGALAGYINAQRTGKGDSVDVAQYEAMLRCEGFYALNYLNTGALPVREGSHSTSSAGYGTYICQDGVPIYTLILGPGVVRAVLADLPKDADITSVAEAIKATAFKITRAGELMAREASKRLGVQQGILDLSLAPTPAEGDSVAQILEAIGVGQCGGPGTTAALAMLNDAVKKGGVMASSSVGGLSGAFIPVSEDAGMIRAAEDGALSLEKLEAMTCVCSVGLDMIAVPGDTSVETIFGIIADECAIGMINSKTTAVRLIPAIGKTVGDQLDFGGLLGFAPVMPVNQFAGTTFAHRGGRMPAPLNSLKN